MTSSHWQFSPADNEQLRGNDILDLPLSWARTDVAAPALRTLKLPLSRRTWIPCADIPPGYSFLQLLENHLLPIAGGFILQSCNENLARFILQRGGQVAQVGMEALLAVKAPLKPSVLELARRGSRWGEVVAVTPTPQNRALMAALWKATVHHHKPRLQYAFRTEFDASVRGFALVGAGGNWLGAMTISQMKQGYWNTELLLRRQGAPVGIMEALILAVKARLQTEAAQWLSLGAVPFITTTDPLIEESCWRPWAPACRGRLITRIGRLLRFGYDYRGLHQFKTKFGPEWRPLYLCGWPDLPLRVLPDLSWATRHLHLVGYAALQRLRE